MLHRLLPALAVLLAAGSAHAAADVAVSIAAPSGVYVYQSARYTVNVANIGNKGASSVVLTIQLPRTGTSPTVTVMGTLGAFHSSCTRSGTALTCNLNTVAKGANVPVFFDIALPYATAPLTFTAAATTTSAENSTSNNSASRTASLLTYPVTLTTPQAVRNRHCTGSSTLTSFFECELFPSSISYHDTILNTDGSITFVGAPASYTGAWSQPSPNRLIFSYYNNGTLVADFDGRGVSGACFEGLTIFPNSSYISLYQVCRQ